MKASIVQKNDFKLQLKDKSGGAVRLPWAKPWSTRYVYIILQALVFMVDQSIEPQTDFSIARMQSIRQATTHLIKSQSKYFGSHSDIRLPLTDCRVSVWLFIRIML